MKVDLVIIDPQNDFMDQPGSALPVPGATEDMKRLAAMTDRLRRKIDDIHVTLDSHHPIDVGHPGMWRDANGNKPAGFTLITAESIKNGIWTPIGAMAKPKALQRADGTPRTIKEYMIDYALQLEAQGKYNLMVWPEHCLIGSPGHNVQPDLFAALNRWAVENKANIDYVTKGTNVWTEHYGALSAEVPLHTDPSTGLNTPLLQTIEDADMVAFAGEALSHCLRGTVDQIFGQIHPDLIKKFYLLTDCTSSIGAMADGGPDFPAISEQWMRDLQKLGLNLTTSTEFLA